MEIDFLNGSVLYRLLGRLLDGIVDSVRRSAVFRFAARVVLHLRLWSESSLLIRLCARVADGFGASLRQSAIVRRLLKEDERGRFRERGFFFRLYSILLGFLRKIYRILRLWRLLEGSLLLRPWIWLTLAMAATPLLPTMAVLGLVILSAFSLFFSLLQDESRTLRYSAVNKYVWLYMLAYGLATLVSVTPRESLPVGLITVCFVLFYHLLVSGIETRRQLRFLLGAVAGAGAIVALYGIYQFLNPAAHAAVWLDGDMFEFAMRVYSTLGNPNVLGKYLLLAIPLAFAGLLISRTNQGRLFFLGAGGLMCVTLVLTYSRGAYLGFLFAAAFFLLLLDRRFLLPGILAGIVLLLAMPEAILYRFFSIGDMQDTSTSYRVFIWIGTLNMLRDYWFSGIGPGEAAWAQVYPAYSLHAIVTPHSHNLFLQITSDAGAPGLLIFLGVIYQYFKAGFAALRRKVQGPQRILVIAAMAAILGFLVQSATDYTFYNFRVMLFFWSVLAVGVVAVRYDKLREGRS